VLLPGSKKGGFGAVLVALDAAGPWPTVGVDGPAYRDPRTGMASKLVLGLKILSGRDPGVDHFLGLLPEKTLRALKCRKKLKDLDPASGEGSAFSGPFGVDMA